MDMSRLPIIKKTTIMFSKTVYDAGGRWLMVMSHSDVGNQVILSGNSASASLNNALP